MDKMTQDLQTALRREVQKQFQIEVLKDLKDKDDIMTIADVQVYGYTVKSGLVHCCKLVGCCSYYCSECDAVCNNLLYYLPHLGKKMCRNCSYRWKDLEIDNKL
jgi:hypothetical protein